MVRRLLPWVTASLLVGGVFWSAARTQRASAKDPLPPPGARASANPLEPRLLARKPHATLVFAGRNHGKLKPCGCTSPQMGGIEGLATAIELLRERASGALAALSLGWVMAPHSAFRREQAQASLKALLYRQALHEMGFAAHVLGPHDLYVPELVAVFEDGEQAGASRPTLPLNVRPTAQVGVDPEAPVLPWADLRVRSLAVRVLSVVEEGQGEMLRASGLVQTVIPPATALQQVLNATPGTLFIVAVDGGASVIDGVRAAMRAVGPCVIVDMSGATSDQPRTNVALADGPLVVGFEDMGKAIGVLDVEPAPDGKGYVVSYDVQTLTPAFRAPEQPSQLRQKVAGWFDVYKQQVRETGLLGLVDRRPEEADEPRYVGSASCARCHEGIYQEWNSTPHAKALRTLKHDDYAWDPECLVCHIQGAQRQRGSSVWSWFESGFSDPEHTPHLGGVGCESCHGPGSTHLADPYDKTVWTRSSRLRARPTQADCMDCHDLENSVGFAEQFKERLPKVDHSRVPGPRKTHAPRVR
jgi:hypothetical protein